MPMHNHANASNSRHLRIGGNTPIAASGDEPINLRLAKKVGHGELRLIPRSYQKELCRKILDENVVIYLGTGLGKTFIVVLFLISPQIDQLIQFNKKVVFLAPTQDLVKQQAEYINKQVLYRVKIFCGRTAHCGNHIDHWDKPTWDAQLKIVDIMFMTPQIFSAAISTNHLTWTDFAAVIFDEVHHARKSRKKKKAGHPYFQIMKSYEAFYKDRNNEICWPKPRLVGLTASLINNMPKNRESITEEIAQLEKLMFAKCITNLQVLDTRPKFVIHTYTKSLMVDFDLLSTMFEDFVQTVSNALKLRKAQEILNKESRHLLDEEVKVLTFVNRLRLSASGFSIKPSSFPNVISGLKKIRSKCGLWMLRSITEKLIEAIRKHRDHTSLRLDIVPIYDIFTEILEKLHSTLDNHLSKEPNQGLFSHTSPKALALLDRLKIEFEEFNKAKAHHAKDGKASFSCITFVTSRLEVVALNTWFQKVSSTIPEYSFIKCDYAIGLASCMASKYSCITKRKSAEQYAMLNKFRNGELNTIVTTSVLEEGIDLPVCSTVICYDLPANLRQYVQSRGRARQNVSTYVSICEEDDFLKHKDTFDKFADFEVTLKKKLSDKDIAPSFRPTVQIRTVSMDDENDVFLCKDNSIRIDATTAKTILHMYVSRLAFKTPFIEGVRYSRSMIATDTIQTTIFLPSGCSISEGIQGGVKTSQEQADNSAVVATVKALYEAGELNEYGAPTRATEANIDALLASKGLAPKFEQLNTNSDEECEKVGEKEIFIYKPTIGKANDYLASDYQNRVYKFIPVVFKPYDQNNRQETGQFFENPKFAFIVDASTSLEFIPPEIINHYGKFVVNYPKHVEEVKIVDGQDHEAYFNYTHRVLTNCLGFTSLNKEHFRIRCRFYVVLLDQKNRPDIDKMRRSCRSDPRATLKENDIVKTSYLYQSNSRDTNNLMLVKRIRDDMNATSIIPGTRYTFLEHAEHIHTDIRTDRPIIEAMPISPNLGSFRDGKKSRFDHRTTTRFYLSEFLERFDDDASCIFQSFLLPFIIYRLYITLFASDLDKKFVQDTQDRRQHVVVASRSSSQPIELHIEAANREMASEEEDDGAGDQTDDVSGEVSGAEESDDTSEGDEMSTDCSADSSHDSDSDYDEDKPVAGPNYRDMLLKRCLELNSDYDDENFERWNMADYNVPDLQRLQYVHSRSERVQEHHIDNIEEFRILFREFGDLKNKLLERIGLFFIQIRSDDAILDEEVEFKKRAAKVDQSIAVPIKFDRSIKPIRIGSRERGLIEALTQRRAGEPYNLEGLENIGDSYLKYVTSVVLFKNLDGNEGFLSSARSRLTCNKYFSYLARRNNLGAHAITKPFSKDMLAFMLGRNFRCADDVKQFYNKMRPKSLADTFESIVGAYLVYQSEYEAILAIGWLGLDIFEFKNDFDEFHENAVVFSRCTTSLIDGAVPDVLNYYKSCVQKVSKFEVILGYKFNDPSHLIQAFTHASSILRCTRSYERLEFLGDAILDFLVTATLARTTSMKDPGQITASRSALVNNYAFARLALKYKFDLYIQHCNHELYDELTKVRLAMEEDPDMEFLDLVNFDNIVKLLGDSFESVAGAIYIDSGCSLDTVWGIYYPMMKEDIDKEFKSPTKNLMVSLYEAFPGDKRIVFSSKFEKNDNGQMVQVCCRIHCYNLSSAFHEFTGEGISKKQAKSRAVRLAMENAPSVEQRADLDKKFRDASSQPRPRIRRIQGPRAGGSSRGHGSRGGQYSRGGMRNSRAN